MSNQILLAERAPATTRSRPAARFRPASSIDSLLDEIDSVLETNAEALVQGFVQKGGPK